MSRIELIERQIQELSTEDLAEFRKWFAEFDHEAWDRQFQKDAEAGRLESLAKRARDQHATGKTTKF